MAAHLDVSDPEAIHAELARACNCAVPAPDRRIESMGFVHDGVRYEAAVGRRLIGQKVRPRRRNGRDVYDKVPDGPVIVAIFAGSPYMVWLDAKPLSTNSTHGWVNPFIATKEALRI